MVNMIYLNVSTNLCYFLFTHKDYFFIVYRIKNGVGYYGQISKINHNVIVSVLNMLYKIKCYEKC